MEKAQAEDYLTSLLNKTLRVTTTDTRMFLGLFKCTDSVRSLNSPAPLLLSLALKLHPPLKPKPKFKSSKILTMHIQNTGPQHNPLPNLRIPAPCSP
jgi:hypothetical protein